MERPYSRFSTERQRIAEAYKAVVDAEEGKGGELTKNDVPEDAVEFQVPEGTKKIGVGAFSWHERLERVSIPDSVTDIGTTAFAYCRSLRSVDMSKGLVEIGERAFAGCWGISDVVIPDGVLRIGRCAFSGCRQLTSVTIPDSVEYIGESAFKGCGNLKTVYVKGDVEKVRELLWNLEDVEDGKYAKDDVTPDDITFEKAPVSEAEEKGVRRVCESEETVQVVFRKTPNTLTGGWDVAAFFPETMYDGSCSFGNIMYVDDHDRIFSEVPFSLYNESRPCSEEEYTEFKKWVEDAVSEDGPVKLLAGRRMTYPRGRRRWPSHGELHSSPRG